MFSTLRFIKASIQQTAARRRIQRWILLVCRILLLLLLIWAISQPFKKISSGWFESGRSMVAAIVVDTSYSMQLKDRQTQLTLLETANNTVLKLLDGPLLNAQVAIYRSQPQPARENSKDSPDERTLEKPHSPSEIYAISGLRASPFQPQPSPGPLARQCTAAISMLNDSKADTKWLVIISDLQSREFPSGLPALEGIRTVLIDLHPEKSSAHGITSVKVEPEQPIPGMGSTAHLEVTGKGGDQVFVSLNLSKLDPATLEIAPVRSLENHKASFDQAGRTRVLVPIKDGLPAERWLSIGAQVQSEDDLVWDRQRSVLVELPPRQTVKFIDAPTQETACKFMRLALDPWEGTFAGWPVAVKRGASIDDINPAKDHVAVVPLTDWPDEARAKKLVDYVKGGGTLVLFLQPGLEQSWPQLSLAQQTAIRQVLPGTLSPTVSGGGSAGATGVYRAAAPSEPDRIIGGLTDPSFRLNLLAVRRFVPFSRSGEPTVSTILHLSPAGGDSRSFAYGMVFRRTLGSGECYTCATLPDSRFLSPAAHPLFLAMLVNMSLRPPAQSAAQNVELGEPLVLAGRAMRGSTNCRFGCRIRNSRR